MQCYAMQCDATQFRCRCDAIQRDAMRCVREDLVDLLPASTTTHCVWNSSSLSPSANSHKVNVKAVGLWEVVHFSNTRSAAQCSTFRMGSVSGRPPEPLFVLGSHYQLLSQSRSSLQLPVAPVAPPRDQLAAAALALCTVVDFNRLW